MVSYTHRYISFHCRFRASNRLCHYFTCVVQVGSRSTNSSRVRSTGLLTFSRLKELVNLNLLSWRISTLTGKGGGRGLDQKLTEEDTCGQVLGRL